LRCLKNRSSEKIAKISPADPEIIVLLEIIKKEKKNRKIKRKKLGKVKYTVSQKKTMM